MYGLELLLVGIALLFAWTALLYRLLGQLPRLCARWAGSSLPVTAPSPTAQDPMEQERIAAIAIAVHLYRTRSRHESP
ncbi:MAG: OadG family protein [Magnetococcales bacterium]|nr:OadG family protein [Magnetococcales bacterium]MBF0113846.1 OadG family protein [Magnetococcales bacterium]